MIRTELHRVIRCTRAGIPAPSLSSPKIRDCLRTRKAAPAPIGFPRRNGSPGLLGTGKLSAAKTADGVVDYHPPGLQEGIADGRAYKA